MTTLLERIEKADVYYDELQRMNPEAYAAAIRAASVIVLNSQAGSSLAFDIESTIIKHTLSTLKGEF
jgi:hypothetical protein